ncbi:hypothetical protein [Cellulomonas sp. NPDC089187]|uniref:hypothetical protein n=1 Tax=Cellulomonas sp. NPDC089187 TaxID=3154970 RepID=UPI003449AC55
MTGETPTVPARVRTWAYVVGIVAGVVVAPALLAYGLTAEAGIASAVAGGCSALAFGYRPTRADA